MSLRKTLGFGIPTGALALAAAIVPAQGQKPTEPQKLTPEQTQFFETKVRPLLAAKCLPCHGGGRASGSLSLDTAVGWQAGGDSGPSIVAGSPEKSPLNKRIKGAPGTQMPPSGRLTDSEIAIFDAWVKMGAPDPRVTAPTKSASLTSIRLSGLNNTARAHWAFQPLRSPAIPKVVNTAWVKNPIDAFVLAKLEASKMKPAAPAGRAALIRRAYYDMIGLPPTVEEVRAFLADKSPNAWEHVVDSLLASPHYGERWGRHWLDTARYSDTTGNTQNAGKNRFADFRYANAWTYRDWVIGAMNSDLPYNQFLMQQVAADKLGTSKSDPAQLAALGFLTVGKRFNDRNDLIDERIDTLTKATMGLTVACARCHDHPFDPIPTADYYSLHGIFNSLDEPEVGPEIPGSGDPAQKADFDAKIAAQLIKGREAYYGYITEQVSAFNKNAVGLLMLRTVNPRSKEGGEIAEKYNISPSRDRYLIAIMRLGGYKEQAAIFEPLLRLSRLEPSAFPTVARQAIQQMLGTGQVAQARGRRVVTPQRFVPMSNVNPLIAAELKNLTPRSLEDVAEAYARAFAKAQPRLAEYIEAKRNNRAALDPATAQLLEFPLPIPMASAFSSPEALRQIAQRVSADLRAVNRFPFDEINRLELTHPGAPGHAMIVEDSASPRDSRILIRGDKTRAAEIVPRQFLSICSTPSAPQKPFTDGSGRLELARAIVAPSNPLTPRVLVNRVWMHHFGEGFVRTPDDLGNQSEKPSHPELLDWLATHFTETGWSQKKLHKWILMSNTYQQSTDTNPAYEVKDPANRLLWHANLRRLDFEAIRDSMVFLTGKMDATLGGKPANITDEPYIYRRSVYGYIDRLSLSDLLTQFDFSNPDAANTERISTIVPQQALFFMNSAMAVDVARQVVGREEFAAAKTDDERVRALYLILLQRSPRPEEVQLASGFLAKVPTQDNTVARSSTPRRPTRPQLLAKDQRFKRGKFAAIQNNTERVERAPLTPWELYAQALLCSNEFVYVN